MELWASGFNAWGNLDFSRGEAHVEPRDLKAFKCVLRDKSIRILRIRVSATLVSTYNGLQVAGSPDEVIQRCLGRGDSLPNNAFAGNDQSAAFMPAELGKHLLVQYASFEDEPTILGEYEEMEQIVANQTTFTALASSGRIYTWGDGRYPNCLGRDVNESLADKPSIVEDIVELATRGIRKISSGGYVSAVLTEDNDLYIWGGRAGDKPLLEGLDGTPTPIDLDGESFMDVAVGMNHILVLTTGRKLFVVGSGEQGQLGWDVKEAQDWTEVILPLKDGQHIVGVHAGYKNSLVLVGNIT